MTTPLERSVFTWQRLTDAPPDGPDLAEDFHEASKFFAVSSSRHVRADRLRTSTNLQRSSAVGARSIAHLRRIPLPVPAPEATGSLIREASTRSYRPEPLALAELGALLWLSYGAYPGDAPLRRPVASGGALYPLELYLIAEADHPGNKGVYHYDPIAHALEEVRPSISDAELVQLNSNEGELLRSAAAILIICGLFQRSRFKYGLRGYRFCLMEAGAVTQQSQLAAQSCGLGSVPVAGLYDDAVEELCGLDGVDESFLGAVLIGHKS